uniref:Triosephosphate isomerase n=1 Tax=Leptocylindrus danicus TaxID=163516 RepID=A0A7S2PBC9_9STRA
MKFTLALSAILATQAAAFAPSFASPRSTALDARKPFISGNWKLNPQTREEAIVLGKAISESIGPDTPDADVALFVPYVFIEATHTAVGEKLMVGAEGVCPEIKGAFTGAVSATMLKSIGVQWALAGHSERRTLFGETDAYINGQCIKLIEDGMSVMLCIGESLDEYEKDLAGSVCAVQLKKGLAGIKKEDLDRVAIAYEPVWAIGTGKVATPEVAQKVHEQCRAIIADMYDQEAADAMRILYGGSVTPDSVDQLMAQPDIDGALVGGASLDASKFSRIINFQPM